MQLRKFVCGLTAAALTALPLAACGGRGETTNADSGAKSSPGITKDEIKLGGTFPLSGPASAYQGIAVGARAYFDMINDKGGVNGRKISFKAVDDGFDPTRSVQATHKLVERDRVFALFGSLGTANLLATREYVNSKHVPQVYVSSGASTFGADTKQYPWLLGWRPDFADEGRAFGTYLKENRPHAKVAALIEQSGLGKDWRTGFDQVTKGTDISVVATQRYEPTEPSVASHISKLKASKADTFVNIASPKFAAQAIATMAKIDWHPLHMLISGAQSKSLVLKPVGLANANGIVSMTWIKDIDDPRWKDDADTREYLDAMASYEPDFDAKDAAAVNGWSTAATMVEALRTMKEPTRAALMKAIRNMRYKAPMLLPGITVETGPNDGFPVEQFQMMRFDGNRWKLEGDVIAPSGR